jgi:hypothetical protein
VCETARGARVSRTMTARAVLACTRYFRDRGSGLAHSDTGFVNAGDRVRLSDRELAAVAREVGQAPAAVEIRLI